MLPENCTGLAANLSLPPCTATQEARLGQEECQVVKDLVAKCILQGKESRSNIIK